MIVTIDNEAVSIAGSTNFHRVVTNTVQRNVFEPLYPSLRSRHPVNANFNVFVRCNLQLQTARKKRNAVVKNYETVIVTSKTEVNSFRGESSRSCRFATRKEAARKCVGKIELDPKRFYLLSVTTVFQETAYINF